MEGETMTDELELPISLRPILVVYSNNEFKMIMDKYRNRFTSKPDALDEITNAVEDTIVSRLHDLDPKFPAKQIVDDRHTLILTDGVYPISIVPKISGMQATYMIGSGATLEYHVGSEFNKLRGVVVATGMSGLSGVKETLDKYQPIELMP
jgi:hypothetical protein